MQLEPGTRLDRYTVLGPLGRGGMAVVYLVRHEQLGTVHAMKVLALQASAIRDRLLVEGKVQARLQHPNIVTVTDVVDARGAPGLVMEYVDGPTLEALLAEGPLAFDEADGIARGVLDGVEAAHRFGLVHRDLKPGNVLLRVGDDGLLPKVTDFGLVKVLAADGSPTATRSGATLGTPAYMAPEQIRDASRVDARADVWSLGAILYELVTGRRAFDGADTFALFEQIGHGRFVRPRALVADLPARMERAIEAALVVDREARVATVAELAALWRGEVASERAPDSALVARARRLHTPPGELPPSAPSGATFDGLDAPAASRPEPTLTETGSRAPEVAPGPSHATPAPSRRPWGRLVGAGFAVLVVAGVVFGLRPGDPVVTVDAMPRISGDAVAQDHLRRGWDALLAADLDAAERELSVAAERAPDAPLALLVLATARRLRGDTRSVQDLERVAPLVAGRDDVVASLYGVALAGAADGAAAAPAVESHLARWPDDDLVRVLGYAHYRWVDREARIAAVDAAIADDPRPALPWLVRGDNLAGLGRHDEAAAALREALARAPGSLDARRALGETLVAAGRFAEARDEMLALLAETSDPEARGWLAIALLHLGRADEAEAQRRLLADPLGPPAARWGFAISWADALAGVGRPTEALALLEEVGAEATAGGAYQDAALAHMTAAHLAFLAGRADDLRRRLADMRALIASPDLPASFRTGVSGSTLVMEASLAAIDGRGDDADALVARLERAGDPPARIANARRWAEIARRDPVALRARLDEGCLSTWYAADALERLGDPAASGGMERFLADPRCEAWGPVRAARAAAHVRLAAADPDSARAHLDAFAELWPSPEPDAATAVAARALAP